MIRKLFKVLLRLTLPEAIYVAVSRRINATYIIMTGNTTLKIFWGVILFPIILPLSLLFAIIKTICVWVLGPSVANQLRYAASMFFNDIMSERERKSLQVAIKRLLLFHELVTKGKEKLVSFGSENPDKIFYVIRPYYFLDGNELSTLRSHLLYNYYRNLHFIAYALNKEWIPVIDWENYGTLPHMENFLVNGTNNGWEYYWNQPSEYSLQEVYRSKNVVLSNRNTIDTRFMPPCRYPQPYQSNAESCARLCPKYDQWITFNEPTEQYIYEKQRLLFPDNARILGVSVRGTVYGVKNIPNHPAQPKITQLIAEIKKSMRLWEMDYLFFACESDLVTDEIKSTFGDKVLVLPRLRYKQEPTVDDNPLYVAGQRYQTNLDYITEMALLSRCNALLAAYSGGVRIAVIWNNNEYEYMKIM